MAWSSSGVFTRTFADALSGIIALNLGLETHKAALFGNGVTPDFETASATTAYNDGTWLTANEVTGTGYTAGGVALANTTVTLAGGATNIIVWDADDPTWSGATFSGAYGCLIYADALTTPVADQGIAAVYFGGPFQVTAGAFSIEFSPNGIYRLDVT